MRTSETKKRNAIVEIIRNRPDDDIIYLWNTLCSVNDDYAPYMIFSMGELDGGIGLGHIQNYGVLDLMKRVRHSLFNPNDEYFWFIDEDEKIYSMNYLGESEHCPLNLNVLADFVIENYDDLNDSNIWNDTDNLKLKQRFLEVYSCIDPHKLDILLDSKFYSIVKDNWDEIAIMCIK